MYSNSTLEKKFAARNGMSRSETMKKSIERDAGDKKGLHDISCAEEYNKERVRVSSEL